jgi:hypothetical protein
MTRILLVETASPKRVCHKLEQILKAAGSPEPEISVLCRESSREAFPDLPGITIYPTTGSDDLRLLTELNKKRFDVIYAFWTGEKQYRRIKLLALQLRATEMFIIGGDGNEFRLTWKAICRHAIFRRRHPLPSDHWDYLMPQAPEEDRKPKRDPAPQRPPVEELKVQPDPMEKPSFQGDRVLVLQSAEPNYVLQVLDRLREIPLFDNPRYTLFCRNRPEVAAGFQDHPSLFEIRTHSETKDSWKHLQELRRSKFNAIILFLTGDPSYRKLKLFAFLLGVPLHRTLIFNENLDCFFFNWNQWFTLIVRRMQWRPVPEGRSGWSHSARILVSLILKSVVLPFRFFWLLLVWLRLRSAGLRSSRKNHDDS